ncbi:hypothetical protein [Streptomyces rapamycinicus]|uniref:Uncharacterized protein n=2 Tax=Streptomyces rapamycinicus TaxID=1226757 RepID=A0A3L8RJ75_STRRN|nr:hypothetical protein [Streptomyces rapamycinicus]MBB4784781.1 hypothetical protein [Streptomyces rapamycinicus]RLV79741.1 hypothetical protein D3C57_115190 [Streptomyces rapamycinicus NRRL 5491]UTO65037.1 hypothetical protein LJB45_23775 [Streptomyces rapamycinicus]UTP32993.1 hypothetical protein LIV37_28900 [Streptomyces rapamycinicus NRRL 5491]
MSVTSAMPVAVRLPRTVAARRALLAALFLGGFLALGFLFGGSAHAAERSDQGAAVGATSEQAGVSADRSGVSRLLDPSGVERARQQVERTTHKAQDVVQEAVRPIQEPVERQAQKITKPIDDLVGGATSGELPVRLPEVGIGDAIGVGPQDSAAHHGPAAGHHAARAEPATVHEAAPAAPEPMGPGAHAQAVIAHADAAVSRDGHGPVVRAAVSGTGPDGGAPAPLPLPRSPLGATSQYTGDSGASRGGNTQAALPPSGVPSFGLKPGTVRAESSAPTRERFNEVLEFPG